MGINIPAGAGAWGLAASAQFHGSGSPVAVVTPNNIGDIYVDDTGPGIWQATGTGSSAWSQVGSGAVTSVFGRTGAVVAQSGDYTAAEVGALAATAAASGDLSGSYPGPTVAKVQGVGVSSTVPTNNQGLVYDSTSGLWVPSAIVNSFNGRTGAVALEAADVEGLFTAAGQLLVGTGSGAGELLAQGANNTFLGVSGGALGYYGASATLTYDSATITANVTLLAATLTTVITTPSLAIGTWLLTFTGLFDSLTAGATLTAEVAAGTATATFSGPSNEVIDLAVASTDYVTTYTCIATITAAGTIVFEASCSSAGTALANGGVSTGYTAVMIA